jgi:hypothetical protein
MADDADRAQVEIDAELENARRATQKAPRLIGTGHCHNCEEPQKSLGQLFCDQEFAKDFEIRQRGSRFNEIDQ